MNAIGRAATRVYKTVSVPMIIGATIAAAIVVYDGKGIGRALFVFIAWCAIIPFVVWLISTVISFFRRLLGPSMRLRLNGWQRLGVLASVLWVVGWGAAGVISRSHELDRMLQFAGSTYAHCLALAKSDTDGRVCSDGYKYTSDMYQNGVQFDPPLNEGAGFALVALISIPIIWLLVWIGWKSFRWIRAEFEAGRD
jgi:hypothetical protein